MRTIPMPADEALVDNDDDVAFLDWKDSPDEALSVVDSLLRRRGLEIVQYDTGSDEYLFRIEETQK